MRGFVVGAGLVALAAVALVAGGRWGVGGSPTSARALPDGETQDEREAEEEARRLRGRAPRESPPPPPEPPPPPTPAQTHGTARVVAERYGEAPPLTRVRVTAADGSTQIVEVPADGIVLPGLPPGRTTAEPEPVEGWDGVMAEEFVAAGREARLEVSWEPVLPVEGRVVSVASGRPVRDATVVAIAGDKYPLYEGKTAARWRTGTDAGGRFRLPAVPAARDVLLLASAPGHAAGDVIVPAGARAEAVLRLEAGGRIEGVVRDVTGAPVADAVVFAVPPTNGELRAWLGPFFVERVLRSRDDVTSVLYDCDPQNGEVGPDRPPWVLAARTDAGGSYVIDGATLEHVLLLEAHALPPDGPRRPSRVTEVVVSGREGRARVDLDLRAPSRLRLLVRGPGGGPLAGAEVTRLGTHLASEATDAGGRYDVEHPSGPQPVRVVHPDAAPWTGTIDVPPRAGAPVEVRLDPAALVTVEVVGPDGAAVVREGLEVSAWQGDRWFAGRSEGPGRWRIPGLAPAMPAQVWARIFRLLGSEVSRTVVPPASDVRLALPVVEEGSRGEETWLTVRLPEDVHLPARVLVGLWSHGPAAGSPFVSLRSDERFEVLGEGLSNVAQYRFTVREDVLLYKDSFEGREPLGVRAEGCALARVEPSDLADGNATVVLSRALVVRGIVVEPDGRPVVDAAVAAGPGQYGALLRSRTDHDGRFSVAGVPADANDLAVAARGWPDLVVPLRPPPEETRVELRPGGRLVVLLRGPGGRPVTHRHVEVAPVPGRAASSRTIGSWVQSRLVLDLVPGTWSVRDLGAPASVEAEVRVGESAEVILHVP